MLALTFVPAFAACRPDPPTPSQDASAGLGRSWTTPPAETIDGGIIAERLPRVVYRGGTFFMNPRITTVTFKGEDPTTAARLEQFGDAITKTAWWRAVVDSYCIPDGRCIGEGRPGAHARLDRTLPAEVTDMTLRSWLAEDAAQGRLGVLTSDTILLVYLPKGVAFGDAVTPRFCAQGRRAHHTVLTEAKATPALAVIPRCSDEAEATGSASHEILEATTNPDSTQRGFAFMGGSQTLGFTYAGLEPVDPCGLVTMDDHWTVESGFVVQRAWSNRAASLGQDPCVPARADRAYTALVPRDPAVRLANEGDSAKVVVDAAADRPVPPWAASVFDLTGYQNDDKYVDVSIDRATIAAGETATVTITLRKKAPNEVSLVAIVSTLGVRSRMWPLAVVMQ